MAIRIEKFIMSRMEVKLRIARGRHKMSHRNVVRKIKGNDFKIKKAGIISRDEIVQSIINKLHISEDVINGAEIISLIGKRNLVIENYVKVVEYEKDKIIVKTKRNYLCINGHNLVIEYLLDEELRISGRIDMISFVIK